MTDKPDPALSLPPIDLREAKGTIVGDHGTMIIDPSGRIRESTRVSIAPPLPLNQRNRNLHLRGRDDLVEQLVASLGGSEGCTPETAGPLLHTDSGDAPLRVHLLHGPGGCGKTSIAEQVAYEAIKRHQVEVWWVNAVDQTAIETSMKAVAYKVDPLARDLGGGAAASDVLWQGLMSRDRPWLLVVDGADDPSVLAVGGREVAAGTGWIRRLPYGPGLVLVTSRDGTAITWGDWWDRHAVGMLNPEDGADVLLDYTTDWDAHANAGASIARAGSRSEAEALADRLGGLPLALKLAGSYLALTSASRWPDPHDVATFTGYRKALDTDRVHHLPDGERDIIRLCGLSLQLLERRGILHARPLLRLLSCLADAPIPDQVIQPTALAVSNLFGGLNGMSLQLTVDSLASLGLVDLTQPDFSPDTESDAVPAGQPALVILHPMVRYSSRHTDEISGQMTTYLELAADVLHQAAQRCGDPEDPKSWLWWHALAPHCTYLMNTCTTQPEPDLPTNTISRVASAAHDSAVYLYARGLYEQAETELRNILAVRRQLPGDNITAILDTHFWLACALRDRDLEDHGKLKEAERELRAIYETRTLLLSNERWGTTEVLGQLAHIGWYTSEGLTLLDRGWEGIDARPVLDMLDSYEQLAITLAYQNRNSSEAKHMYQLVYEARKRILGDNHPSTLDIRTSLAVRLYFEDQLDEAEAELRAVHQAERRTRGHDHPSSLITRKWIADVLVRRGLLEAAEAEFRAVLDSERRTLGDEHPNTLITRHYLAGVLVDRGRLLAEAEISQSPKMEGIIKMSDGNDSSRESSWFRNALASFQEALGLIDSDERPGFYGVVLHDVADLHMATRDPQKAAVSYRESVKYKLLADDPSDLATTMLAFSSCLIDCDELIEARTSLDQTKDLLAKEKEAGNVKPAQQAVRVHSLGIAYERLGNNGQGDAYAEALDAYRDALKLINAEVDPGSYATVLKDIGDVYRVQARLAEAHTAYEKAAEYMRRRDGAASSLASILVDLGRVRLQIGRLEVKAASDGAGDQQSGLVSEPGR